MSKASMRSRKSVPSLPGIWCVAGIPAPYDVNFGKEVGAAAFILLNQGISGVTVSGISNGKIRYIDTKEAIKQRLVDTHQVAIYEALGTCFGRMPEKIHTKTEKLNQANERHW